MTINPTNTLSDGAVVYLGISDAWYYGSGLTNTQGTAAHTYTGSEPSGASQDSYQWVTGDNAGALNSATITDTARPVFRIASNTGRGSAFYATGPASNSVACAGTAYTSATIAPAITLRQGSASGPVLPILVELTTVDSGSNGANYVTVIPAADLAPGTYHLRSAPHFLNAAASCTAVTVATASFTIADSKTLTISDVSTDNYINASEDDSALTISGVSTGFGSGATVTVGVDGSGTDISGKTGTTDIHGDWSVSLTAAEVQALDASNSCGEWRRSHHHRDCHRCAERYQDRYLRPDAAEYIVCYGDRFRCFCDDV